MYFSKLEALSFFAAISSLVQTAPTLQKRADLPVPVPWSISSLSISNTRHGTGGWWKFTIADTPTASPQGFNTTCNYYANNYYFAHDGAPYNAPCDDSSITFGLFPNGESFTFNITHLWGSYGDASCNDNGTWTFSKDDVSGQESDVVNNFGQSGYFSRSYIAMYPKRAKESTMPAFS